MSTTPTGNPKTQYLLGDDGNWYNADGERVYYWVPPAETDSTIRSGGETQGIGQDLGGYYTESEIRSAWDADDGMGHLKEQTDWDNYWGFISERQGEIQAGNLVDPIQGNYAGEAKSYAIASTDADYQSNSGRDEEVYQAQLGANTQLSQQDQMAGWIDQNADLMSKYGIQPEFTNGDGDVYKFNGSTYTRTYKAPGTDYGELLGAALVSAFAGGAVAPALASGLGGIGGATGSASLGNGVAAGISNAATQGLLTGSVDPRSVLSSAVIGGLNPGGMLAENFGQATNTGVNIVPDNVVGGFLQGAGNSATSQLITDGSVDLGSTLLAGGLGAGKKAITDLFSDTEQFSVESEMERIRAERRAMGLPDLSTADLYAEAMFGNMTGKSDLGGLIGDDGLLSFIPAIPTGGLNKLLGGGIYDPNSIFTGPDGKKYTDVEVLQMGQDPAAIYFGEVDGWSHSLSPSAGQPIDLNQSEFLNALAEQEFESKYGMTPTDFLAGGGTVDQLKQIIAYGPLDETYNWSENPRGNSQYVGLLTGLVDGYSTGSLNDQRGYQEPTFSGPDGNTYLADDLLAMGINPEDVTEGKVPGWSQIYYGIQDALNISNYQDVAANAPDPNGGSVAIINLGGGETAVDPNATLPGSNITVIDAITQGIIDGILVDNSGSTAGGNTVGNTTDVIGNENAVSTDDVLAGADTSTNTNTSTNTSTNTNTNENAVNTNDTLAGTNTNTNANENAVNTDDNLADNENAVSTDDELPSGGGGGGGGDGLFALAGGSGLPPVWTDLDPYTTIKRYKSQRTKLLDGMLASLNQQNAVAPASFIPKSPSEKELFEAGMFS